MMVKLCSIKASAHSQAGRAREAAAWNCTGIEEFGSATDNFNNSESEAQHDPGFYRHYGHVDLHLLGARGRDRSE
jgi:hypothetical protein